MDFGPYTVRILRTFTGREGVGCNAVLLKAGKKVGTVDDMADGGGNHARFDDGAEEGAFRAFVAAIPAEKRSWSGGEAVAIGEDMFLSDCIVEALKAREAKKLRKALEKKTLFVLKGDDAGSYRVMNVPFDARVRAAVLKAHGDALDVILNEAPERVATLMLV